VVDGALYHNLLLDERVLTHAQLRQEGHDNLRNEPWQAHKQHRALLLLLEQVRYTTMTLLLFLGVRLCLL
jgi:hypothetical protein